MDAQLPRNAGGQVVDPYEVLQVPQTASAAEVERAYRQRAREVHPDKSSEASAADEFRLLTASLEFLQDPQKRARFDERKRREEELRAHFAARLPRDEKKRRLAEELAKREAEFSGRKKAAPDVAASVSSDGADLVRQLRRAKEANLAFLARCGLGRQQRRRPAPVEARAERPSGRETFAELEARVLGRLRALVEAEERAAAARR